MERSVLRARAAGAAMACDIVVNYPLWIVAKRVGAGLSAFPPLHRLYAGGARSGCRSPPTTIIEDGDGVSAGDLAAARDGDLAASAGVRRDRGRLCHVASRAVHHRGARPKSIGPSESPWPSIDAAASLG